MALKLPVLCARPGNVGVQIDSFRSMNMFNRPRCGKFTAHFLGMTYENASLDNHKRVIQRTARRAQIAEHRLARLREHEQQMISDEHKRSQRRKDREAARQQAIWLHHQAMKLNEQRQLENEAAIAIQRMVRGMWGRQDACLRYEQLVREQQELAARRLQRFATNCEVRKKEARRLIHEREHSAASVLQRCTRRRQSKLRSKAVVLTPNPAEEPEDCAEIHAAEAEVELEAEDNQADENKEETEVHRDISLDLLFSDDGMEPDVNQPPLLEHRILIVASVGRPCNCDAPVRPVAPRLPRRPVSIKRVGGGFRHSIHLSPPKLAPRVTTPTGRRFQVPTKPAAQDNGQVRRRQSLPANPLSTSSDREVVSRKPPSPVVITSVTFATDRLWHTDDDDEENVLLAQIDMRSHVADTT